MTLSVSVNNAFGSAKIWLHGQWVQAERLRPMIGAVAAIIFISLLIGMFGWVGSSVKDLRKTQTDLARLQQQLTEGSWAQRKKESETLRFQLNERLWTAETAGLAEASFERWLRERVEKGNVRPDAIRIQRSAVTSAADSAGPSGLGRVQRMTAKVVMPFEPEALMLVLRDAASFEKILVIDRLLIRSGRNALIEMDISTFVTLPESAR